MTNLPCDKADIEWIRWYDASNQSVRKTPADLEDITPTVNINLGWVMRDDEEIVVLAHGKSKTEEHDIFVIPTCCIIERFKPFKSRGRA